MISIYIQIPLSDHTSFQQKSMVLLFGSSMLSRVYVLYFQFIPAAFSGCSVNMIISGAAKNIIQKYLTNTSGTHMPSSIYTRITANGIYRTRIRL